MQNTLHTRPVTVLYVEDEENDAFFMRWAFEHVAPGLHLRIVADGRQAVDYLAGRNHYGDRAQHPLPSLVLLDLNLPSLTGFGVLDWMRQQPEFKSLPVVVFSSSSLPQDKQMAHALGANGYMQKPSSGRQFIEAVEHLKRRWLSGSGTPGTGAVSPVPLTPGRDLQ